MRRGYAATHFEFDTKYYFAPLSTYVIFNLNQTRPLCSTHHKPSFQLMTSTSGKVEDDSSLSQEDQEE